MRDGSLEAECHSGKGVDSHGKQRALAVHLAQAGLIVHMELVDKYVPEAFL
jgi:hypothetical protein